MVKIGAFKQRIQKVPGPKGGGKKGKITSLAAGKRGVARKKAANEKNDSIKKTEKKSMGWGQY